MSDESGLWSWLRDEVLPIGQYSRIESGETSPGFPDVDCQILFPRRRVISFKLELKHSKHPQRTNPFNDRDGVRKSQKKWIRDNTEFGGLVWIVAEVGEEVFVIPGKYVHRINGASLKALHKYSDVVLPRRDSKLAYEKLYYLFKEHSSRIGAQTL